MRKKTFGTLILGLVLTLGWAAQAFAMTCQGTPQGMGTGTESHSEAHDPASHAKTNCHGCEKGENHYQTPAQFLINPGKIGAVSVAQKTKPVPLKAVVSEFPDFKARTHQFRGPNYPYNPGKAQGWSLFSLQIRLQV